MKRYGLIGKKLGHSFSRRYFTEKFHREKIDASYDNLEVDSMPALEAILKDPAYSGFNVTIPYKEAIIPHLDQLDEMSAEIGAVNTIDLSGGKLTGYNTDAFGFQQSIKPFLTSAHERALILGTGGASKAVAYVLKRIGIDVVFVSRKTNPGGITYAEINEYVLRHFLLIVNTTPLGTYPNVTELPQLPYDFLSSRHLLYDLTYNPTETLFLKKGRQRGATCINGLNMLHLQAERSWQIWNSQA